MSLGRLRPRDYTDVATKRAYRDARSRAKRGRGAPITWREARQRAAAFNELCGRHTPGRQVRSTSGQAPGDIMRGVLTRDARGRAIEGPGRDVL